MTGSGNWTYYLPGRHPALIDAGTGAAAHLDAVADASVDGPRHVLVSHAHSDHVTGASAIAARWPDTRFSKIPWPERDQQHAVTWHSLGDGHVFPAGDDQLQVVHTPGHAPDHVAFWHEASRTLFSGDLIVSGTTVVIPADMGGSLQDYLWSLERVLALAPARLLPAHGDPIDDPAPLVRRYIAHRLEREAQIVVALGAGLRTIDGIVQRIYQGLAAPLVPMAEQSVLAHLRKLNDEGRAAHDDGGWRLVRPAS
jgi:endoribonuclease LACTB2